MSLDRVHCMCFVCLLSCHMGPRVICEQVDGTSRGRASHPHFLAFVLCDHPPTRLFHMTIYYHITTHPIYVTIIAMHNKSNPINNFLTDMKMTTHLVTKD